MTSNPLAPPLARFFARLNVLNGLVHLQANQLELLAQEFGKSFSKNPKLEESLILGTALTVTDWTGETDKGWLKHYSTGSFRTVGREYIDKRKQLIQVMSAWTVSQAYEAFETFVFDIAARYMQVRGEQIGQQDGAAFAKARPHVAINLAKIVFWRSFVRWKSRRKADDVLRSLRQRAPHFAQGEETNTADFACRRWLQAVTEVRHAVTHSDMRVETTQNGSTISENDEEYFPTIPHRSKRLLVLTPKNARESLGRFADYSFLIFKGLSIAGNYDWAVLQGKLASAADEEYE